MTSVTSALRRPRTLVSVLVAASFALAGCGTQQSEGGDDPTSGPTGTSQAPSNAPSQSQNPKSITVAVPIYVAGGTGNQVKLFREFRQVQGEAVSEAARLVESGTPLDPDYRTLWPGGTVLSAEKGPKQITVLLNADAFTERPDGMSERDAELALQQMVRTLQGVVQDESVPVRFVRDTIPAATPTDGAVEPEIEDDALTTLFGIDITEPIKRADWRRTMSLVNVTIPAQGSTVVGDVLDAEGVASSFEANVPWEIRKDDEVVMEGFATAEGWMEQLYPWFTSIDVSDLAPGDYTFVAMTDNPSQGEGSPPSIDSKEFTIR